MKAEIFSCCFRLKRGVSSYHQKFDEKQTLTPFGAFPRTLKAQFYAYLISGLPLPDGCRLYTAVIYEHKHPGDIRRDNNVASLAFRHCPDPALLSLIKGKLREDFTVYLTGNTGVFVRVVDSTEKCKSLNVKVLQSKDPFGRLLPGSDFKVLYTQDVTECRPSPRRPAISPQGAYYAYPNNNPLFTVFDTLATPCRHVSATTLKKNRRALPGSGAPLGVQIAGL